MPPDEPVPPRATADPAERHPSDTATSSRTDLDLDLVEYLVVVVSDLNSLGAVTSVLADLVASKTICILDLVCVSKSADGGELTVVEFEEIEEIEGMAPLEQVEGSVGGLLSARDIDTASRPLRSGLSAILLLVEDRWARELSIAARHSGGGIVGGGRVTMRSVAASRREHLDLLSTAPVEDRWTALLIDPVAQITELADLVARGLVSPEEFERQRRKVFGA